MRGFIFHPEIVWIETDKNIRCKVPGPLDGRLNGRLLEKWVDTQNLLHTFEEKINPSLKSHLRELG